MAYLPSQRLLELVEKKDKGDLTEEEVKELSLRCEAEKPSKTNDGFFGFGLGFIIGSFFD